MNTNNPLPGDDDLKSLLIIIVIIITIININYPPPGGAYLRLAHAVRLHPHTHLKQPNHHGSQQVSGQEYKNEQLLIQIMIIRVLSRSLVCIYQKSKLQIRTDIIFCSPGPVCNQQQIQFYLVCLLQLIFSQ